MRVPNKVFAMLMALPLLVTCEPTVLEHRVLLYDGVAGDYPYRVFFKPSLHFQGGVIGLFE